jgi:hypothetical protein
MNKTVTLIFILITLIPCIDVQAESAPNSIPESCHQKIDAALLIGPWDGLRYVSVTKSWRIVGVPDAFDRREFPFFAVDLVRIRYRVGDELQSVWVALGIETEGEYLPLGPWTSMEETQQLLKLGNSVLHVSVNGFRSWYPKVSESGVDWERCSEKYCPYAAFIDTTHRGFTNHFIFSGGQFTPNQYGGFLLWKISPLYLDWGVCAENTKTTMERRETPWIR